MPGENEVLDGVGGDATGGQVDDAGAADDSGSADTGSDSGSDSAAAGEESTRALGPGDYVAKAATEAYRNLSRAKDGTFTKGPAQKAAGTEAKPAQKPAAQGQKPAEQAAKNPADSQQIDPNRVPDSWTKGAKALWESLPPTIKAEVNKREADARNMMARTRQEAQTALGQHKEKTDFASEVEGYVNPRMAQWAAKGVDARALIKDSYQSAEVFHFGSNEQKVQLLRNIVKNFGIQIPKAGEADPNIGTVVPNAGTPPQPQFDPSQFRDPRLDPILKQIQESNQRAQQEQNTAKQQAYIKVQADLDDFVGNPENDQFLLVWDDMAKLLESGMAPDIKSAYEKAVMLNPTARAAAEAKTKAEANAQATAAAAEAKRAAGVRAGGKPGSFAPAGSKSTGNTRTDIVQEHVRKFLSGTAQT
jgi:hypothetical protein